jgi:hypothetical protein
LTVGSGAVDLVSFFGAPGGIDDVSGGGVSGARIGFRRRGEANSLGKGLKCYGGVYRLNSFRERLILDSLPKGTCGCRCYSFG